MLISYNAITKNRTYYTTKALSFCQVSEFSLPLLTNSENRDQHNDFSHFVRVLQVFLHNI